MNNMHTSLHDKMPRECFIMSDGDLPLFDLCMNRIGCVSITCYTLLQQSIFVGSFHVLKRLCYRGNIRTIYMRTISKNWLQQI